MDSAVQTCFVALKVPTLQSECHVTVGMNHAASPEEVADMKTEFAQLIRPYFPIEMEVCNYNPRGSGNGIPAYDVRFKDSTLKQVVENYYRRHYRQKQGGRMFPLLNPHISVDDERSLADVEQLICQHQGRFQVTEFIINVRPARSSLSAPSAPPPIQTQSQQWLCPECGVSNAINVKECATATCSQWRPLDMMPKKAGDWMCCGTVQFASRSACFKCGKAKNGSMQVQQQVRQQRTRHHSYAPSSQSEDFIVNVRPARAMSSPQSQQQQWLCPECGVSNAINVKECATATCSQWRPLGMMPRKA